MREHIAALFKQVYPCAIMPTWVSQSPQCEDIDVSHGEAHTVRHADVLPTASIDLSAVGGKPWLAACL